MTETLIPPIEELRADLDRLDLRTRMFIDGAFRDAASGDRFVTENPATGRRSPMSPRAVRRTSTSRSQPPAGPPTTVAGRAWTRPTASGSSSALRRPDRRARATSSP